MGLVNEIEKVLEPIVKMGITEIIKNEHISIVQDQGGFKIVQHKRVSKEKLAEILKDALDQLGTIIEQEAAQKKE